MIKHVNQNEFETEILQSGNLYVVDFFATWCGPCKMLAPVIEELSELEQYKHGVTFLKVDIDENDNLAMKYKVEAVPTLIFIKNGAVVKRETGYMGDSELKKIVDAMM